MSERVTVAVQTTVGDHGGSFSGGFASLSIGRPEHDKLVVKSHISSLASFVACVEAFCMADLVKPVSVLGHAAQLAMSCQVCDIER